MVLAVMVVLVQTLFQLGHRQLELVSVAITLVVVLGLLVREIW